MPPRKSNDAVVEQVKILFEMIKEIKQILTDMRNESVSKEQLKSALELHDAKSEARHQKLEDDIIILKRIIYGVIVAVFSAFGKSFLALFTFIIK
jgi:ferritin-like metal-binding protein YciE